MKIMLDTNICIYIINYKPAKVFEKFSTCRLGDISISSVTAGELAFGVEKSGSYKNRLALQKFLAPLEVMPFDEQAIWHYGRIRHHLQSLGKPIGSLDMLIAAHAVSESMTLVTNNTKEFERVPNLIVENWV